MRKKHGFCGISYLGILLAGILFIIASSIASGRGFTVFLLPDTQYYTYEKGSAKKTYVKQLEWIRDNAEAFNTLFTIHLGDITDINTTFQWDSASYAHSILDDAGLKYSVVPGNHDGLRNTEKYNEYFGPQRFQGEKWYGVPMNRHKNDNNCTFFEYLGLKFMVVSLEYAPTKDALCWADSLIGDEKYRNHRVIVVTHCYLDHDGNYRNDCATGYNIAGSGGEVIWNELVRRHGNIFLVLCGHIDDSEYSYNTGIGLNTVHEILTDYQYENHRNTSGCGKHGDGWIRYLRFIPGLAESRVYVRTIDVLGYKEFACAENYDSDPSNTDHRYYFAYDMSNPPNQFHGVESYAFNDRTVNSDSHRQQRRPAIASSPEGDFVVVWEDDSKGAENTYQIYARGFCKGGCERFEDIVVNTDPAGQQLRPDIAMAADGSFIVVWEDDRDGNGYYQIYAALFSEIGENQTPVGDGDESGFIEVNEVFDGQQLNPAVAITPDGKFFVVVWGDDQDNDNNFQIMAREFELTDGGLEAHDQFEVDIAGECRQLRPDVAMNATCSYAVAWQDNRSNSYRIHAKGFHKNAAEWFLGCQVSVGDPERQMGPEISMAPNGSFIIVWQDDSDGNGYYQIHARGYDNSGEGQWYNEFPVNNDPDGQQLHPAVAMHNNDIFVATWEDDKDENKVFQIYAAVFNINGDRICDNITVNTDADGQQFHPAIAAGPDDYYFVTWQDDMDDNGWYEILARGLQEPLLLQKHDGFSSPPLKDPAMSTEIAFHQNYPNPFNPTTTITYNLPAATHVTLEIFNILGENIRTLLDSHQEAGSQAIEWDGRDDNNQVVATGVYFYRLRAGDFTETKKMMLLK